MRLERSPLRHRIARAPPYDSVAVWGVFVTGGTALCVFKLCKYTAIPHQHARACHAGYHAESSRVPTPVNLPRASAGAARSAQALIHGTASSRPSCACVISSLTTANACVVETRAPRGGGLRQGNAR